MRLTLFAVAVTTVAVLAVVASAALDTTKFEPRTELVKLRAASFMELRRGDSDGEAVSLSHPGPLCNREQGMYCPLTRGVCCADRRTCCSYKCGEAGDLDACVKSPMQVALEVAESRMKAEGASDLASIAHRRAKAEQLKEHNAFLDQKREAEQDAKKAATIKENDEKQVGTAAEIQAKSAAAEEQAAAMKKAEEEQRADLEQKKNEQEAQLKEQQTKVDEIEKAKRDKADKAKAEAEAQREEARNDRATSEIDTNREKVERIQQATENNKAATAERDRLMKEKEEAEAKLKKEKEEREKAADREATLKAQKHTGRGGGQVCNSWGDTHFVMGQGAGGWNLYNPTPFLMAEYIGSNDPDQTFRVEVTQVYARWGSNTVDNDVAVYCGRDLIIFRQPRDPSVAGRPTLYMNGKVIPERDLYNHKFVKMERARNAAYYVHDQQDGGNWKYYVSCHAHGHHNTYSSGWGISVMYPKDSSNPRMNIYGTVLIDVDPFFFGKMRGACGWNAGGNPRQPIFLNQFGGHQVPPPPPEPKEKCVAKPTLEWVIKCRKKVEAGTGVKIGALHGAFKRLDKAIEVDLNNFVDQCAADSLCGAEYNTKDMEEVICNYVANVKESIAQDYRDVSAKVADCKLTESVRKQAYEVMKSLIVEKFDIDGFCSGGKPAVKTPLPGFPKC